MKHVLFYSFALFFLLLSCGEKEEKIYTTEELGVSVEWNYYGWNDVKNETSSYVTLITEYPLTNPYYEKISPFSNTISPHQSLRLQWGLNEHGTSIDEAWTVTICLTDETKIPCYQTSETSWSKLFYSNTQKSKESEIVEIEGKRVRHDLVVKTYHITDELIDLYKTDN